MTRVPIPWLGDDPDAPFPPATRALREPNGLLAAGGDLSPRRLLNAYRRGIFPWYMPGEPILWWLPEPRCVFRTDAMHVPRRLARWLRGCDWRVEVDRRFAEVVAACAAPRHPSGETWITDEMVAAYRRLHRLGYAHSLEVMHGDRLVGGLYGVGIGAMFFAESMFSAESQGSKVALLGLARLLASQGAPLIDAQVASSHLFTLGAELMPREVFMAQCAAGCERPALRWHALEARDLAGV